MSLLTWVVAGLLVGVLVGAVVARQGRIQDAIVGVVGAVIGGWLHSELTGSSITLVNPAGLAVALLGAALFVLLSRTLTRGRTAI